MFLGVGVQVPPPAPPKEIPMNKMEDAPQDGTRILILQYTNHFVAYGKPYERDGTQIVEGWFHDGHWNEWCGDENISSTAFIDPIGWYCVPEDYDTSMGAYLDL